MAALNFPDSPNDGDEFSGYVYDSAKGVWNRLPTLPALDLVNFSAVAPSNPQDGQFWFDTTSSKMYVYYNDGSSAQWVSTIGGLASQTGTEGQFLIHDGTEWLASEFTSPGSVLQVVRATNSVNQSTSSITYTDANLQVSITPSSTNSKIYLTFTAAAYPYSGASNNSAIQYAQITTDLDVPLSGAEEHRFGAGVLGTNDFTVWSNIVVVGYHEPSSTSTQTYKVRFKANQTSVVARFRNSDQDAQLIAMEVAG